MAVDIDVAIAVTDSYCTLNEADSYLENNTVWNAASDEDKEEALLEARYHIDITYECDLATETVIPDALKYATAILAAEAIADSAIFNSSPSVQKERVKADSVEAETEYFTGSKSQPKKTKQVTSILQSICTKIGSSVFLVRG